MTSKQNVFLSLLVVILLAILLLSVFGDNGLAELNRLKRERDRLVEKNEALTRENLALYSEIDRLKNDPQYIEHIARQELGMIGPHDVIIKIESARPADGGSAGKTR